MKRKSTVLCNAAQLQQIYSHLTTGRYRLLIDLSKKQIKMSIFYVDLSVFNDAIIYLNCLAFQMDGLYLYALFHFVVILFFDQDGYGPRGEHIFTAFGFMNTYYLFIYTNINVQYIILVTCEISLHRHCFLGAFWFGSVIRFTKYKRCIFLFSVRILKNMYFFYYNDYSKQNMNSVFQYFCLFPLVYLNYFRYMHSLWLKKIKFKSNF